jgi:hypothetical protein
VALKAFIREYVCTIIGEPNVAVPFATLPMFDESEGRGERIVGFISPDESDLSDAVVAEKVVQLDRRHLSSKASTASLNSQLFRSKPTRFIRPLS